MNHFKGNKNMFWRQIKQVRNGEPAKDEMVKDVDGRQL